ncbi:MAG: DUF1080 domain-containing protein [Bacteroidales bacterium]
MKQLILITAFLLIACNNAKNTRVQVNSEVESPEVSTVKKDSTYYFDGKTLDGWEITNFGPQGPVSVSSGSIILGMGDGCTGITCMRKVPEVNYQITLEAMRMAGVDFFCGLTFPVNKSSCTLIVGGWGGTVVGLSCIDGLDASENETSINRVFEKNRWYSIKLAVTEYKISAWIDGHMAVNFNYTDRRLSLRPEVQLSKPFGIASWCTTAAIRNIRITGLDSI